MAATEITTATFIDFSSATYGGAGLDVTDASKYNTLSTGTGNGVKFSFATAGWIVLNNDTGSSVTYTVPLDEPTEYVTLGVTFTNKTFTVANGDTYIVSVDSRYKTASDGMVYLECSGAGKALVIKRYTVN